MSGSKYHRRFTDEERAFLRETIPGRTWRETSRLFEGRFGRALTMQQVKGQCHILGVRRGYKGAPGHIPASSLSVPVGAERKTPDGYTMVKVSMGKAGNPANAGKQRNRNISCWRLKHHVIWEQTHGQPIPKGHAVIFANHDVTDLAPENIVAVPRGVLSTMNACGMKYYDAESLRACIAMANIRMALNRKKRGCGQATK